MTQKRPPSNQTDKPAVLLLSGGLDSATMLALAQEQGYRIHALSFDYGQRHVLELRAARALAKKHGAEHHIITLALPRWRSALTDKSVSVPKGRALADIGRDIPATYVSARNTLFLAYALAFAETAAVGDIFIGANALDYGGYPDCRPAFLEAWQKMANLATKAGVTGANPIRLHAPLLNMTKKDIITTGLRLRVDYAMTSSCYDPDGDGRPCLRCDSCLLRAQGFEAAGVPDPLLS